MNGYSILPSAFSSFVKIILLFPSKCSNGEYIILFLILNQPGVTVISPTTKYYLFKYVHWVILFADILFSTDRFMFAVEIGFQCSFLINEFHKMS